MKTPTFPIVENITVLRLAAGEAIPERAERDVVLLTWVVEGCWGVRDSFNNGATVFPGDLLRVSAGTGLTITESNPSATEPARVVQLRLRPLREGMISGYEVRNFFPEEMEFAPLLIASPNPQGNVVNACAAVQIFAVLITPSRPHQLAADSAEQVVIPVEGEVVLDGSKTETAATVPAGKQPLIESPLQSVVVLIIRQGFHQMDGIPGSKTRQ